MEAGGGLEAAVQLVGLLRAVLVLGLLQVMFARRGSASHHDLEASSGGCLVDCVLVRIDTSTTRTMSSSLYLDEEFLVFSQICCSKCSLVGLCH